MTIGELKKLLADSGLPDDAEVKVEDQEYGDWLHAITKFEAGNISGFVGIAIDYARIKRELKA